MKKPFKPANPFVVGRYLGPDYFCDRQEETATLIRHLENGRNVALISKRRMGKTGLIHHIFAQPEVAKRYSCIFIDIYATTTLAEFVYTLGKAVYEQLASPSRRWAERFVKVVSSLRVGFNMDAMTGEPGLNLSLGEIATPERTLDEIFDLIEQSERPCIIAIDEFQQVINYKDHIRVEALLRHKVQQCKKTQFVYAGSKQHMMTTMFSCPTKPFYQSALTMGLDTLPLDVYADFCQAHFAARGKKLDREVVAQVYADMDGITWFMQMLVNELFAATPPGERCTTALIDQAYRAIIYTQQVAYSEMLARLSPRQKMLLQAIAKEGQARAVTSTAFVRRYHLTSASSVQSALRPLTEADTVTFDKGAYSIYDRFFAYWLRTCY